MSLADTEIMGVDRKVHLASGPKPIEAPIGYGDWIPVIEMRRVIENGKTVRMQLVIRGEEGQPPRSLEAGESLALDLRAAKWDVLAHVIGASGPVT